MIKFTVLLLGAMMVALYGNDIMAENKTNSPEPLLVKKCQDFLITGDGSNQEWDKMAWQELSKLDGGGADYRSRFKICYSSKGIYLLFEGEDQKISTKFDKDFDTLYQGDVFEAFFHPDPKFPLYFEYEINQLEKEIVFLVPNIKGTFYGWIPWKYENGNRVLKKVRVKGGNIKPEGSISSWSAELFFPYSLLRPLSNVPPVSGTTWNANFCRLDYDTGKMIKWAWARIVGNFHEFEKYRPIRFE